MSTQHADNLNDWGVTFHASWESLGVLPPKRENRMDLCPRDAAQADHRRLKLEIRALKIAGRLSELQQGYSYEIHASGVIVRGSHATAASAPKSHDSNPPSEGYRPALEKDYIPRREFWVTTCDRPVRYIGRDFDGRFVFSCTRRDENGTPWPHYVNADPFQTFVRDMVEVIGPVGEKFFKDLDGAYKVAPATA